MNVEDIRTFVTAAEAGSISTAAQELHLTQPAASRRLQRLERLLGTQLIDRGKRPFALTDAGRTVLERCRRFLSVADELKTVGSGSLVPSRELRIGVAQALTELALIEPVEEMQGQFPTATVRLHTGWSRDLLARVKTGALDAGIILMPQRDGPPAGVTAERVARDHLAIVAPRSWPGTSCTIRQLRDQRWILNPDGCAARSALQHELARARLPLRVAVESYNYELQLRLIARGRGLGLVPHRLLLRSPTRSKLKALRVRELAFPQIVWMIFGDLSSDLGALVTVFQNALARRLSASSKPAQPQ